MEAGRVNLDKQAGIRASTEGRAAPLPFSRMPPRSRCILVILLLASGAHADVISVPGHAVTIQSGIALAAPGDEVVVQAGDWAESIDLLGKAITVRSLEGPGLTSITGAGGGRTVRFVSGEGPATVLEGFTIEGGGGLIVGGGPTVRGCRFVGNSRDGDGGGLRIDAAAPLIEACLFQSNAATGDGGGVFIESGAPEIRSCRFLSNSAGIDGGAIGATLGAQPLIVDGRFTGNLAGANGGAVAARAGSTVVLVNSLLRDNVAEFNGGALYHLGDTLAVVTNCTITANAAGFDGGAIYNQAGAAGIVSNTVCWGNLPDEIADTDEPSSLDHCDVSGGWSGLGTGNFDLDPLFLDDQAGDYRIDPASPCVDAGLNAAPALPGTVTDLDGKPRTVDGDADGTPLVDVGAYEHQVLANDNCADAIEIGVGVIEYTNIGATTDGTPHDWCGLALGADVWFRFVAPCDAQVVATASTDGFPPFVALYPSGCPAPGQPPVLCGSSQGTTAAVTFTVTAGETYRYRVGGVNGAQGAFALTLSGPTCAPIPINDTCGNAQTVLLGNTEFSTLGATTTGPNELAFCGSPGPDKDVWFRYFSGCSQLLTVSLCESNFDSSVVVYDASCPDGPGGAIACNDDNDPCDDQARVSLVVESSTLYRIRVGGFDGDSGIGTMNLSCAPIPACNTDTNDDDETDIDDLINVILDFGTDGAGHNGDVNGNGLVDVDDVVLVVLNFGACEF
jgi:hypothetical protein